MAKVAVTKRDADKVLAAIRRQFAGWIDPDRPDYGPELLKDFDWLGTGAPPYAIVWEQGSPYDWAVYAGQSYVDEEFGFRVKGVEFPPAVWVEAITGWALAIHPRGPMLD